MSEPTGRSRSTAQTHLHGVRTLCCDVPPGIDTSTEHRQTPPCYPGGALATPPFGPITVSAAGARRSARRPSTARRLPSPHRCPPFSPEAARSTIAVPRMRRCARRSTPGPFAAHRPPIHHHQCRSRYLSCPVRPPGSGRSTCRSPALLESLCAVQTTGAVRCTRRSPTNPISAVRATLKPSAARRRPSSSLVCQPFDLSRSMHNICRRSTCTNVSSPPPSPSPAAGRLTPRAFCAVRPAGAVRCTMF